VEGDEGKILEELLREVCFLIKKVGRQVLRDFNITPAQFEVLQKLYFKGSMRMSDMSSELGVAKSTITGIVGGLEEKGYVAKERSSSDRRVILLSITPEGEKIIHSVIERRQAFVREMDKQMEDNMRTKLTEALKIFSEIVRREAGKWYEA